MTKKLALCVMTALLPGCLSNVVTLKPEAKNVTIVSETTKPIRCEVLGRISGMSRSNDGKEAQTGAENDFRNQASEFEGANYALVETERNNRVGTSDQRDVFLGGKAMRCMTDEMEEAEAKKEAEAQEQKEKAEAEAKAKEEAKKEEEKTAAAEEKKKGKK
ncbi:MAG TPA: DUF4156 domain-containing protein [Polyangiaceae bacterium]|nr:DUF4156 domain-containing protein [Polyangiaceae bacterium]